MEAGCFGGIVPSRISVSEAGKGLFVFRNGINDEVGTVLVMLALLFIAFSAERDEDEYTDVLRLRSWFWAGITYGVIYIACDLLIYEFAYLYYMWFVQGALLLLLYILIFKAKLYLSRRECDGQ